MGHSTDVLDGYEQHIRKDYPDENIYAILRERSPIGISTQQRPDLLVVARHDLTCSLCAIEIGQATTARCQTFVDAGIPDVRWFSYTGECQFKHLDDTELTRRKQHAEQCVPGTATNEFVMAREVWTQAARREVFACFLSEFGPLKTWPGKKPIDLQAYKRLCARQARIQSAHLHEEITPKAIEQQLDWACSVQKRVDSHQVHTFLMCKSAAREVGLIDRNGLPGEMYFRLLGETDEDFNHRLTQFLVPNTLKEN